jgi:hypothetical protein
MVDIEKIAASVKFICFACNKESGCQRIAGKRAEIKRAMPEPGEVPEVTVYCEHCGTANRLTLADIGRTSLSDVVSKFLR